MASLSASDRGPLVRVRGAPGRACRCLNLGAGGPASTTLTPTRAAWMAGGRREASVPLHGPSPWGSLKQGPWLPRSHDPRWSQAGRPPSLSRSPESRRHTPLVRREPPPSARPSGEQHQRPPSEGRSARRWQRHPKRIQNGADGRKAIKWDFAPHTLVQDKFQMD